MAVAHLVNLLVLKKKKNLEYNTVYRYIGKKIDNKKITFENLKLIKVNNEEKTIY